MKLQRRTILKVLSASGTTGVSVGTPSLSFAQTKALTATSFKGPWEDAHRGILLPAF